jgi:hypothetical protein
MRLPLLVLFAFLFSCGEEDPAPVRYQIDPQAASLVALFMEEGRNRGVQVPQNNLIVELTGPVKSGNQLVCASAWGEVNGYRQNLVQIDSQCDAWRYGGAGREILVFHELGHALLKRTHKDGRFPRGPLVSMMATSWNFGDLYLTDSSKRPYYLDELFNPNTPAPEWAQ